MSKVATAESTQTGITPAPLRRFWNLTIESKTLMGQLTRLQIMAQLPEPAEPNVNSILGGVWSAGNKNLYSLLDGETVAVEVGSAPQQTVSFVVVYEGNTYAFVNGVLSADGTQILDGEILLNPLTHFGSPTLAADGTWSAQAPAGPPSEEPGRGRGWERAGRHRR